MAIRQINSRSLADDAIAVSDIADGSITTVKIADDAVTESKWGGRQFGMRNLITNGDMRVAQRGTSQTGITSGNNFLLDRWKFKNSTAGTWTQEQDDDVPTGEGFQKSWKGSCTTAQASLGSSSQLRLIYSPEAQDMTHLLYGTSNAKTVTLSFWVKSNKTGTYSFTAEAAHGGGRYYLTTYDIDTVDTWEKKTITITGDTSTGETYNSDNSSFVAYSWWFGAGSSINGSGFTQDAWGTDADYSELVGGQTVNLADSTSNYINITGVQLEVGTETTPFEFLPLSEQNRRCQRYYQIIDSFTVNKGHFLEVNGYYWWMPTGSGVQMRDLPTCSIPSGGEVRTRYFSTDDSAGAGVARTVGAISPHGHVIGKMHSGGGYLVNDFFINTTVAMTRTSGGYCWGNIQMDAEL